MVSSGRVPLKEKRSPFHKGNVAEPRTKIDVSLPDSVMDRLRKLAHDTRTNMSVIVRAAVEEKLERLDR